jgi:sodium-coupled neutral amino acid transporter 11
VLDYSSRRQNASNTSTLHRIHMHKNHSISGATSNLVNAIIGAGIVGIPFAIRETGLISGIFLVCLCAFLTDKSLKVLVGTAKHINVPSYETLFESTYGSFGFYFISVNMLIMAYGGCLSYLTIIKDTLPVLLGVEKNDVGMTRSILTLSTMCVVLPISMQRVSLSSCLCCLILHVVDLLIWKS